MLKSLLLACLIWTVSIETGQTVTELANLKLDMSRSQTEQALVNRAALILMVNCDGSYQSYPTNRTIPNGRLVHYVQNLKVEKQVKGEVGRDIRLVTTGVEPLPDPSHSSNITYPGALAEGKYALFLQPVKGTNFYSLVGGWQGVYPIMDGKTIALKGHGFSRFDNLSPEQFERTVKNLLHPRNRTTFLQQRQSLSPRETTIQWTRANTAVVLR
ncbi:hypothetical protein [Brevibacillus fulvus]|uniref:Uncharacterized protein n=1 Tax=Brevibacillus fulvus TaxID=1125967 RepID=A0A938XWM9_9BACL|nr:hypothetical protein [Brevibacillus fulvus]MBM7589033.1 hypothetical protein [Brevibacillus fulvus]